MAQIIDGKTIAATLRQDIATKAAKFRERYNRAPGLEVVLVGDDPASQVYVRNKAKACEQAGMRSVVHRLESGTSQQQLLTLIQQLNDNPEVDGILVQLPLPKHIDEHLVIRTISPEKDVDGFHPTNAGLLFTGRPTLVPCTPLGCIRLIEHTKTPLEGASAVVVGRSNIVGKPVAQLLLQRSATVTIAHSKTRDLPSVCRQADIVIAAVGKTELIKGDWLKEGAVVIDVGINRQSDGQLRGDVHFPSAEQRASWITPVPGGVGPMTIACLLDNTVHAANLRMVGTS